MRGKQLIVCVLLVLLLQGFLLVSRKDTDHIAYRFPADTLRCIIAMDGLPETRQNVGFNYELLKAFGSENSSYMRILPPKEFQQGREMLLNGDIALMVVSQADSIPSQDREGMLFSQEIKDGIAWAVRSENEHLLNALNYWYGRFKTDGFYREMSRRYFRSYKIEYLVAQARQVNGLSPYDGIVKNHAQRIGMDWRLLSAIIWQESQYNVAALSPMSAKGLMQVRDVTAAHYGFPTDELFDPNTNIHLGTMLFDDLLRDFSKEGMDSANVVRFALASYNSGGGTLAKRRAEAAEAGLNPNEWEEVAKMYEKYSNVTIRYIEAIEQTYAIYCTLVK